MKNSNKSICNENIIPLDNNNDYIVGVDFFIEFGAIKERTDNIKDDIKIMKKEIIILLMFTIASSIVATVAAHAAGVTFKNFFSYFWSLMTNWA